MVEQIVKTALYITESIFNMEYLDFVVVWLTKSAISTYLHK